HEGAPLHVESKPQCGYPVKGQTRKCGDLSPHSKLLRLHRRPGADPINELTFAATVHSLFSSSEGQFSEPVFGGQLMLTRPREVTSLLRAWGQGDRAALDQLIPLIYDKLHRLAAGYLRRQRPGHTLTSTALIHEAYLRLVNQQEPHFENR